MNIKITRKAADMEQRFTKEAKPLFAQGDEVGCLIMHGFTGTPANMLPVANALIANGHTVNVPLLSGHGTTLRDMNAQSGKIWLNDALNAYDKLVDSGCKRIFLMGLSMGGLLMTLTAERRECAGLELMSTPFYMQKYLLRASRIGAFVPYVEVFSDPELHEKFMPYNQTYSGMATRKLADLRHMANSARRAVANIKCPLLLIQSRLDDKVDLKSVDFVERVYTGTSRRTIWMEKSPHGCTYGPQQDEVARYCAEFVENTI